MSAHVSSTLHNTGSPAADIFQSVVVLSVVVAIVIQLARTKSADFPCRKKTSLPSSASSLGLDMHLLGMQHASLNDD
jgi:hypothetical protein